MNYTSAKIQVHGELILKYEKSIKEGNPIILEWRNKALTNWVCSDEKPMFLLDLEYREKPKPLFTNSIGEEFYEGDYMVYWFSSSTLEIDSIDFDDLKPCDYNDGLGTEIFKSEESLKKFIKERLK